MKHRHNNYNSEDDEKEITNYYNKFIFYIILWVVGILFVIGYIILLIMSYDKVDICEEAFVLAEKEYYYGVDYQVSVGELEDSYYCCMLNNDECVYFSYDYDTKCLQLLEGTWKGVCLLD